MKRTTIGRALWLLGVAAMTLGGLTAGGYAAAAGDCATAFITEPFRLPGGALRGPATLRLCREPDFTPSTTRHSIEVGGSRIGVLFGRPGGGEFRGEEAPFIVLVRDGRGGLTLVGYALPHRGSMETFALEPPRRRHAAA